MVAPYQIDLIDAASATETALTLFRGGETPRLSKLRMGHFLLD
jgi:hypothetical protein